MKKLFAAITALLVTITGLAASATDGFTYQQVGAAVASPAGLTVTVNSLQLVDKAGSTQLVISYSQRNNTVDQRLAEGSFKLFFTDGTSEPQYGAFNSFFPGDSNTRSYTWEWVRGKEPWLIEWDAGFFASEPTTAGLKWKVGSSYPSAPDAGPTTPPATTAPTSFSGGAITGDVVLADKGSPYLISTPIDIPTGATLTINPGVEISAKASTLFRVQGSLVVSGSSEKPVVIRVAELFIQTVESNTREDAQKVDISFAHIAGGRNFEINAKSFALRDSEIVNQKSCQSGSPNSVKVTSASTSFVRNYFKSICGFDFNVTFGSFGPRGTFTVENNHFAGNSLTSSWLSASALWKDTLTLRGNSFIGATTKVLETGFFKTSVFANSNYWGSITLQQARSLVEGSVGDTFNPPSAILESLLASPAAQTPAAQRHLTIESTPAPETPKPAEFKVFQATLASYVGSATALTAQQKLQIKRAVDSNPAAEKFICTGIRFESAPLTENILVRQRAKAACDYAKQLNPKLSTWFQNKPTKSRSYAGKVLLTVKTAND